MSDCDEKIRTERKEEARLVQIGKERDRIAKENADFFIKMFQESVKNGPSEWRPDYDYDPLWDQMTSEEREAMEAKWLRTRRKLANTFHRQRYEELYQWRLAKHRERERQIGRGAKVQEDCKRRATSTGWTLQKWKERSKRAAYVPSGFKRSVPTNIPLNLDDWKKADWRTIPTQHLNAEAEAALADAAMIEMRRDLRPSISSRFG